MDWSDIGRSISAVAPTIAGVLVNMVAPGVGPLAASGVSFLLKALGVAEDLPDEQKKAEVERALASGNPDILLALKKADQEFAQAMAKLEVDLEELAVRDRESARKMKIETRDWVPGALTVMLTAGFFGMLALMAVHTLSLIHI